MATITPFGKTKDGKWKFVIDGGNNTPQPNSFSAAIFVAVQECDATKMSSDKYRFKIKIIIRYTIIFRITQTFF